MTDRIKGFVVALDEDMREDDTDDIKTALSMIRGVAGVTDVLANPGDYISRQRVRLELETAVYAALRPKP